MLLLVFVLLAATPPPPLIITDRVHHQRFLLRDWTRHVPAGGAVVAPEGLLAGEAVDLWGNRPIGNGAILLSRTEEPIRSLIVVTGPGEPPGDWTVCDISQVGEL